MEDSLNNDSLSLAEEKTLHKELEKLRASMAHVTPFEEANQQIRKLKDALREVNKKVRALFDSEINPAKEQEKKIGKQIDILKDERQRLRENNEPEIKK